MILALRVLIVVFSGLAAGVLFAVALSVVPAFFALPPADYVRTHQAVGRHFDKVMPAVVLTSVAAEVVLFAFTRTPLLLAAATLHIGVSVVSQFGNVPINRRVKALAPASVGAGWHDPRPSWRAWHLLRTTFAVLAVFLDAGAVVLIH
jgi:uncharacterized membrane protein